MPVCTVDVALLAPDYSRALLFKRSIPPLEGCWFTLGGRLWKDETLRDCAVRQAEVEAGLQLDRSRLVFGGAFDEIHDESRFGREVTYHCVNVCWGYVLSGDPAIRLDRQHREYEWRPLTAPDHHPFLVRKLAAAQSALGDQSPEV